MALDNLYPAIISTYMPAFLKAEGCKVYFSISEYNSISDIANVQVIVRNQNTNLSMLDTTKYPSEIKITELKTDSSVTGDSKYYIELSPEDMKNGEFISGLFYKVQLRFTSNAAAPVSGSIGIAAWFQANQQYFSEWSSVCLIKGIAQPVLTITGLQANGVTNTLTSDNFTVAGKFSFSDTEETEKLKSYRIKLIKDSAMLENSGLLYTNDYAATEINYTLLSQLEDNTIYTLTIEYTTYNNYSTIVTYRIKVILDSSSSTSVMSITATPNADEGYNVILATVTSSEDWSCRIVIRRASNITSFSYWQDMQLIEVADWMSQNCTYEWKDTTVESGVWYKYSLQCIDTEGSRGKAVYTSDPVMLMLESDYLVSDNGLSLQLKYNPQVSSYQNVVGDNVIQTLGSQFPIVKRNGNMKYRQFSISGLISAQADEESGFFNLEKEYGEMLGKYIDYNIEHRIDIQTDYYFERKFREKVLDFLNDGEIKLYRSTPEGNILVRLTGISFTPEASLGRLIYSFSATATEIADCTVANYDTYGVLTTALQKAIYEYTLNAVSIENNTATVSAEYVQDDTTLILDQDVIDYEKI